MCVYFVYIFLQHTFNPVRWYSGGRNPPSGGFVKNFINNLRKSLENEKQVHQNLKAFDEERNRVVQSDSVKLLRQKASATKVLYTCN